MLRARCNIMKDCKVYRLVYIYWIFNYCVERRRNKRNQTRSYEFGKVTASQLITAVALSMCKV